MVSFVLDPEGGSSEQNEEGDVRESVRDELGGGTTHCVADLVEEMQTMNLIVLMCCIFKYSGTKFHT